MILQSFNSLATLEAMFLKAILVPDILCKNNLLLLVILNTRQFAILITRQFAIGYFDYEAICYWLF